MTNLRIIPIIFVLFSFCTNMPQDKGLREKTISDLKEEFQSPPNEARPRVWWHWMNGNVTKEGIQKDLDWMEQTGIGGFQNFDANLFTPVEVKKKLVFMESDWKEAFSLATNLAVEKNLEMTIAGSPGWSVTGGPWVQPENGMKKYVWSSTIVEGGKKFNEKLKSPPHTTGPFQNVPYNEGIEMSDNENKLPNYYNDAFVFAFPLNDKEHNLKTLNPKVTSSGGQFNLSLLTDGDLHTAEELPPGEVGEEVWIQYSFDTPVTFSSYSIVGANHNSLEQFRGSPENRTLYVSDDGVSFEKVTSIHGTLVPQTSGSFQETTARFWRFAYETLPPTASGISSLFGAPPPSEPEGVDVAEFMLYASNRIDRFEDQAGFSAWIEDTNTFKGNFTNAISIEKVKDLTSNMKPDGTLKWEVPEGKWNIIRFGYSLTGRQNHPASPEATGLEVDKLDELAVANYINTYLDLYNDATKGQMGAQGLQYLILDSYEAGHMNWTHDFPEEFLKRRGYPLNSWLPALLGWVVESAELSEKFLWDFRKTIGEMISDNHYDVIGRELNKRSMGRYTESHEGNRIYLADGMDVKRNAEIPMSAMWTPGSLSGGENEEIRSEADIRESASVAHIYGKPYVAAESMTSIQNAFSWYPEKLKRTADMEMASGLNRFVIHTSVHQPLDDKIPGFSLGPFGQYFGRHETWSGAGAKHWIDYLSRSCYLLQQGRNVADILYLYAENDNITRISQQSLPSIPAGYEFDFTSATVLKEAIYSYEGKLLAKSGASYSLLQLDEGTKKMTLSTLKKIAELANDGIKIKGAKPEKSPSLSDDMEEFQQLVEEVWSKPNVGIDISLEKAPDIEITGTDHEIRYRHRQLKNGDIYWLNNRSNESTPSRISFRVTGKHPRKWNPQTGEISEVNFSIGDKKTLIDLTFESWESLFIVFIEDAIQNSNTLQIQKTEHFKDLIGPWEVSFQENRGAPQKIQLDQLVSLTQNKDEGIKYFSGSATYNHQFSINALNNNSNYSLDLGSVKNIAEVTLNGNQVGTLWKTPFQIDITKWLREGENELSVKITNTWVNRLIGDAQKPVNEKLTYTTLLFYNGNEPLLPSGLLGKVKILEQKTFD